MTVVLSYETLFEMLRLERSRTELQELPLEFSENLSSFLHLAQTQESPDKKGDIQLKNLLKIAHELYERREKKIITLALDKAKAATSLVPTKSFLPQEQTLFDEVYTILQKHRASFLRTPSQEVAKPEEEQPKEPEMMMVRLLQNFPSFLGPDLDVLGPYAKEDLATLPSLVAKALIKKRRAERI